MNFKLEEQKQETSVVVSNTTTILDNEQQKFADQIISTCRFLDYINTPKNEKVSIKGLVSTISNEPLEKATGSYIRQRLNSLGFIASANGSIPMFGNFGQYIFLTTFAIFNENCTSYIIPNIDATKLNPREEIIYNEAKDEFISLQGKESKWTKRLLNLDIKLPYCDENTILVVGKTIEDVKDKIIDIPEVNDYLLEGGCLIKYNGTAYIYSPTIRHLIIAIRNIPKMPIDITPLFYTTFDDPLPVDEEIEKIFPPVEWLPPEVQFDRVEDDVWFQIDTLEVYLKLVSRKIYQKYYMLDEVCGYDFGITITFDRHERTAENIAMLCKDEIFPFIDTEDDISVLEFLKEDLPNWINGENNLYIDYIEKRISSLNSLQII